MDLGPPIAAPALAEGTPVLDPDDRRVGVVDQVLIEPLRATPDQIAEIRERAVRLAVGRDQLHEEPDRRRHRDGGASPEPLLERLVRRVLDRMRGLR